jgi:hypothetical protein
MIKTVSSIKNATSEHKKQSIAQEKELKLAKIRDCVPTQQRRLKKASKKILHSKKIV